MGIKLKANEHQMDTDMVIKRTANAHQMNIKWSSNGQQMGINWSSNAHQTVIKLASNGHQMSRRPPSVLPLPPFAATRCNTATHAAGTQRNTAAHAAVAMCSTAARAAGTTCLDVNYWNLFLVQLNVDVESNLSRS